MILVQKMGIMGLVGLLVFFMVIPLTHFISKANGGLMTRLTSLKDKRIQIST